jgi:hypothetical protein
MGKGCRSGQPRKRIPNELEILAKAEQMRAEGQSWEHISKTLEQTKSWIRYRIDPTYKELRKQHSQNVFAGIDPACMPSRAAPPLNQEQLRARLSLVPKDTRDLTGRLMGDPIPNDLRRTG